VGGFAFSPFLNFYLSPVCELLSMFLCRS